MQQTDVTLEDARRLLVAHAPDWATCSIRPVRSPGTDNALFILGDDHVLRAPKRPSAYAPLRKELAWLPMFRALPLQVPEVVFHARSEREEGFDFGIFAWIEGEVARPDKIDDPIAAARVLAQFLSELRQTSTLDAPAAGPANSNRGVQLAELTSVTLANIDLLSDEIRADDARRMWQLACSSPFRGPPVWVHGDLKADNMLMSQGKLKAVIDWGLAAVGDPAVDLAAGWTWVMPDSRDEFQAQSDVSEATWNRARGWALYCAVIALSYYRGRSHGALCEQSRHTLDMLGLSRR